jgi:hypothetical protein
MRLYLHQYERIPFQVEFELTVFEVCSLRWAQCGLLIQLFNLRLSWVERFAYRGILWQDIAMFVIHLLYRYLRISGHIEELKLHRFWSTAILGIDEIPRGYHQGVVFALRHNHVAGRVRRALIP